MAQLYEDGSGISTLTHSCDTHVRDILPRLRGVSDEPGTAYSLTPQQPFQPHVIAEATIRAFAHACDGLMRLMTPEANGGCDGATLGGESAIRVEQTPLYRTLEYAARIANGDLDCTSLLEHERKQLYRELDCLWHVAFSPPVPEGDTEICVDLMHGQTLAALVSTALVALRRAA